MGTGTGKSQGRAMSSGEGGIRKMHLEGELNGGVGGWVIRLGGVLKQSPSSDPRTEAEHRKSPRLAPHQTADRGRAKVSLTWALSWGQAS